MPVAVECALRVDKLSVRGGDPSDVIHAKVGCLKTGSFIELKTAEGKSKFFVKISLHMKFY